MKKIESIISPFVENQFPSFYKEEGPQFIAFVKAYYEWLENSGSYIAANGSTVTPYIDSSANISYTSNSSNKAVGAGVLYQARKLPDYRDIDNTIDEFIVQFKEKYLKNIQFDTASNKKLLVKNSLDLYRSKGTERSIDLFFKLVYGSSAEVRYPADNIFRVSDGVWERPEYLEIAHNRYNVDYVGKQIIGAISGAKAFVEKFIRRRIADGYVDLLYISGRQGQFTNGEVIGLNINNVPRFDRSKRSKLIGSVSRVILQDRSRDFKIGDIVSFTGSENGGGALARVESIGEAVGIVDFIFIDGGWGYSTEAESIISEKVLFLDNVVANSESAMFFKLFEQAIQPLANITFTSASANLVIGDTIYRYAPNGMISAAGNIIDLEQTGANGSLIVSHVNGSFTNTYTYYTTGNVVSLQATLVEDKTIGGKVMGIPETYNLTVTDQLGTLEVGQQVLVKNTQAVLGTGTIQSINTEGVSNTLVLANTRGAFEVGKRFEVVGNPSISANVHLVNLTVGTYEIRKYINTLRYSSANNNEIAFGSRIYRYNNFFNKKIAEGIVLTISHDSGSATGNLTFIPLKGYFTDTENFYVDSNTSVATIVTYSTSNAGGDYIASDHARLITQVSNTTAQLTSTSFGTGSQFSVGAIGDPEEIFIGTDLIGANNVNTLDYDRVTLTVASNTGFVVGDEVYQDVNKIAFNPSVALNTTTGFISLPTANTRFTIGDVIKYDIDTGNTAVNNLIANDYYHVAFSNTTGIILSYPYRKTDRINTVNFINFANNVVNESGHYFYKAALGTIFSIGTGVLRSRDNHNYFGNTGGTANTTTYANSNIIKYNGTSTNTSISNITGYTTLVSANQEFASLSIKTDAFGFPKNPQGDAKNTIFSCLNFQKFTIGTIGGLINVDPGSGYNVDPYVLSYQPYIAAFDRKDFIITIDSPTGLYTVGEKVNQTLANLVYYDLKVDSGAYSNTYDEKSVLINVDYDIDSANDFVLYVSNTVSFNSTDDVNSNTDFVQVSNASFYYPNGSYIRYYHDSSNTILTGLSNNAFYYVTSSNSSGFAVSTTSGGSNVNITQLSNVATFNSNTSVNNAADFISITSANTLFSNGNQVRYVTDTGNTAVSGLTNNSVYYVRYANSTGLALSETAGGANVNLTALDPGGSGHFLRYYDANSTGHYFVKYANEFADDQQIIYRTPTGNTAISGLANNTSYFIVSSNTVGFKLADTIAGTAKAINASSSSGESHVFSTIPGFLPGDRVYIIGSPNVNATVQSIYTIGANGYVRVQGNTGPLTTSVLYSYSNPYVSANIQDVDLYQITSTAKGIVKFANTSTVLVKRLTFENTFKPGTIMIGDVSGTTANVIGISEDLSLIYPIGLNAEIEANVITASGQVTSLQVIDSGIGYTNSDVVQYTSADGKRSGTIKVVIDGHGIGKGYYKSSKGFLSEDMYIHDGDYYQEYSYEILSKISVDRYADMFKKVMHTAGTKFFGSALIVEEDSATVELSEIATGQEVQFNSSGDVSSANESIDTDITPNPFANGDLVIYTTDTGNTAVIANITGAFVTNTGKVTYDFIKIPNNKFKNRDYVNVTFTDTTCNTQQFNSNTNVNANTTNIQISNTFITITAHPFANNDSVLYYTASGNTVIGGLTNNEIYYVIQTGTNIFKLTTVPGSTSSIIQLSPSQTAEAGHYLLRGFNSITNATSYYVMDANSSGFKLSTNGNRDNIIPFKSSNTNLTLNLTQSQLTNTVSYYIVGTAGTTVKLSTALNGTPINITANTTTSGANTNGHYLTKIVEE